MKYSKHGFSLIELVVGISISMILMVSLGVFITSGLKNITIQKHLLDGKIFFDNDISRMHQIFQSSLKDVFFDTSYTGVLIQKNWVSGKGNFVFLKPEQSEQYCESYDVEEPYHLKIYEFTAYEGESGNFFESIHTQKNSFLTQVFQKGSYSGTNLELPIDFIQVGGDQIITDLGNHSIYRYDGSDIQRLHGQGVVGSMPGYLDSPTGIAQIEERVFVSDTGNNRIVAFETGRDNFEEFLTYRDGLSLPMGLFSTGNTLYISDAGNKRILKYSQTDSFGSIPQLQVELLPTQNQTLTGMTFEFFSHTGENISLSNFGNLSWGGTGSIVGNTIEYEFDARDFDSGISTDFVLSDLEENDFLQTASYIVKISLGNEEFYRPYFIRGEKLEIFAADFVFPTGVYGSGSDIVVNDFISREWKKFDPNGEFVGSGALSGIDFSHLTDHPLTTTLSSFIIDESSFQYQKEQNMFHLTFDYYLYYDCIDPSKNIKNTLIFKALIQN